MLTGKKKAKRDQYGRMVIRGRDPNNFRSVLNYTKLQIGKDNNKFHGTDFQDEL